MRNIKSHKKQIVKTCVLMLLIALACTFLLTACKNYIAYDESFDFVVEEGCSDHYYRQLSDGQQKMYRMIYKEAQDIFSGENKRNLGVYKYSDYGITKQDALTVWYAFFFDAPKFFFMSNLYIYGDKRIQVEIAEEFRKKSVREKVWSKIQDSVEDIKELLKDVDNDVLKFKIIYDYIIDNSDYKEADTDEDLFDGYSCSIAGVLDGDASTEVICQGYARTLSYLCNMFGIECIYVSSEIRSHAVNAVKIDGSWYYADSTYDDKSGDYSYFLNGDDDTWQKTIMKGHDESENYLRDSLPRLSNEACVFEYGDVLYRILSAGKCKVVGVSDSAEAVTVPNTVENLEVVEIGGGSFSANGMLTSITIQSGIKVCGYDVVGKSNITVFCEVGDKPVDWNEYWNVYDTPVVWNCMQNGITPDGIKWGLTNDGVMTVAGYCGKSDVVEIPESINGHTVTNICANAFRWCKISSVAIPSVVTYIGPNAFSDCDGVAIYCKAGDKPSGWDSDWNSGEYPVVWDHYKTGITDGGIRWSLSKDGVMSITGYQGESPDVVIPDNIEGHTVSKILGHAFENNNILKSVIIPESITFIGDQAFWFVDANLGYEQQVKVSIYCKIKSNEHRWGYMQFKNNTVVYDHQESGVTTEGIKWCLTKSGVMTVAGYAGRERAITIPDMINGHKVSRICSRAFINEKFLKSVIVPIGITTIDMHAFWGSDNLTVFCEEESKPDGWHSLWSEVPVVFDYQESGETLGGIKWCLTKGGVMSIVGYDGRERVIKIPDMINGHKVTRICSYAFNNRIFFKSVSIPIGITVIEKYAFRVWDNAAIIYCEAESKPDGWDSEWCNADSVIWGKKISRVQTSD